MPVLNPRDVSRATYGSTEVGGLFVGGKLAYNKRQLTEYLNPGSYTFQIPEWATYVNIITKGGGGGGDVGDGGYNRPGKGGAGGGIDTNRFWFAGSGARDPITLTVGAGGRGGNGSRKSGNNGDASSWRYSNTIKAEAAGGAGGASSNQNGTSGFGYNSLSAIQAAHLLREEGSKYFPSSEGMGNGGNGRYGGGGAGGNGGILGSYSNGGSGGDGFVSICCWGVDPTLPKF